MSDEDQQPVGDSGYTEITLQPDGRIYVKGLSRQVLDILQGLGRVDPKLRELVRQVISQEDSE